MLDGAINRRLVAIVAAVVALAVVFVVVVIAIDASRDDEIADGIHIGRVDVGGMNVDQARDLVRHKLGGAARQRVRVTYRKTRYVLRPEVAHVRLDVDATVEAARRRGRQDSNAFSRVLGDNEVHATVAPRLAYSRSGVTAFVDRLAKRIDDPARDADIDIRNGKLLRRHAHSGVTVQRKQFFAALAKRLAVAKGPAVEVPVKITERPDRTLADLAKRYPTVLAVNRDAKQLRLYKRLQLVRTYTIAVGMAGLETAAGRYKIQEKVVNPPWHVPNSSWAGDLAGRTIPPGDPQNPLEARWLGFHNGQGIHGTTDLASLGTAASHGCIRMSIPDVKQLFRQVKIGTPLFLQ